MDAAAAQEALAVLQERYNAIVHHLQEEEEKEVVMRAKLKAHTEQRQFAERQLRDKQQHHQHQQGPAGDARSARRPATGTAAVAGQQQHHHQRDLQDHAWPVRLRSSADFSRASLAALSAYVDQLEAQARSVQRSRESAAGGDSSGGGGGGSVAGAPGPSLSSSSLRPLDYTDINRELGRHVVVTFLGTSSVRLPVGPATTFAHVLEEALRYFSLPPTGALLMDLQNCAWPLSKRVLDFYSRDLTPPFVKLVQRRRAIVPFDTADIIERPSHGDRGGPPGAAVGDDDDELDDMQAERQGLLQSHLHDGSGAPTHGLRSSRRADALARCGYMLVFLQLLQVVAFLALALLFNPVSRLAAVQRVVEGALFSEAAFAASPATAALAAGAFDAITTPQEFWTWMQGPLYEQFAAGSLVATDYAELCSAAGGAFPHYHGNDTLGHFCATSAATSAADICSLPLAPPVAACQIMRGTTTCAQWEHLPMCESSYGAFALGTYNVIVGAARLVQHRVKMSACTTDLLNPTRNFLVKTTTTTTTTTTNLTTTSTLTTTTTTPTTTTTTATTVSGTTPVPTTTTTTTTSSSSSSSSTTTTTTTTNLTALLCNGPLSELTQADAPKTAPTGVVVTNGVAPDASAWETCAPTVGNGASKLDSYLFQLGAGRMPGATACSLALDLVPAPEWYAAAVQELAQNAWFDELTRLVELQLNLYNPTLDVLATVDVRCDAMASGGFACQHVVQAMPVLMPLTQYSATQATTELWWLSLGNWSLFALLLLFVLLNGAWVVCECYFVGKVGPALYFGTRGFSPSDRGTVPLTRVTATVASGQCCNVFTWVVEAFVLCALALKAAVWTRAGEVFMLESLAENSTAQLRFSPNLTYTYNASDVGGVQRLYQSATVLDAVVAWGMLMLALKYFHVNVFSSFLVRAFSLACDGLANVGLALAVMLGALFVWHYFLLAKTSVLLARPDYSFLHMLSAGSLPAWPEQDGGGLAAAVAPGGSATTHATSLAVPLDVQVLSLLFGLAFTAFVALFMLPLLASVLIGVVVKLAELVSVEGYYWLTPRHLILARRQQQTEYARVFT